MANVMMSGVYNHFLTSYASQDISKADSHKKNELKDIYKSIVRINKDSPLYLLNHDNATKENAIALKESARKLQGDLSALKGESENSFGSKIASSSNETAASAKYVGSITDDTPSFELQIDELARPQTNIGTYLPNTRTHLEEGNYFFDANINNQSFEFQFTIGSNDTNLDIQDRIARLINKSGINLSANIISNAQGENALQISTQFTGLSSDQDKQFELFDALNSPKKGVVPYFGLNSTSQDASNASFRINGDSHTSPSNHFMVAAAYELELKQTTTAPISISTKSEDASVTDNIRSLVKSYNTFLNSVSSINNGQFDQKKVLSGVHSLILQQLDELSSLGINQTEDGHIAFDEQTLIDSGGEGELTQKVQPIRTFAANLNAMTQDIMLDPMKFAKRQMVNYKNPGHEYANPYVTSEYSGMMFNNYC